MRVSLAGRSALHLIVCLLLPAVVSTSTAASQAPRSGGMPSASAAVDPEPTVVLFTLEGRLREGAADASLPQPLVDRLASDPALARMDVDNRTGSGVRAAVTVNFVFQSTAAYREWYASAQSQALLRDLTAAISDPRRHLRIQRRSAGGWFGS